MTTRNAPVPITLDKPRTLLFNLNAAMQIKADIGTNPLAWDKEEWGAVGDPTRLLTIVRACLRHEDKDITVEQLGDMVSTMQDLVTLSEAVMRAYAHFGGQTDEQFDESLRKARGEAKEAADPLANAQISQT